MEVSVKRESTVWGDARAAKGVEAREEIHDYRKYLPHLEVLLIPLAGEHFQSIDPKSRISLLASGSSPNSAKKNEKDTRRKYF